MAVTKYDKKVAKQAAGATKTGVAEKVSPTEGNLAKVEQLSGHTPVPATIGTPGSGLAPVGSVNTVGPRKRNLSQATPSIDNEDANMMASQAQKKKSCVHVT